MWQWLGGNGDNGWVEVAMVGWRRQWSGQVVRDEDYAKIEKDGVIEINLKIKQLFF